MNKYFIIVYFYHTKCNFGAPNYIKLLSSWGSTPNLVLAGIKIYLTFVYRKYFELHYYRKWGIFYPRARCS